MPEQTRCAIVFDFDDTLVHDSTSEYLKLQGVDVADFWTRHRERLRCGWDQVPAYMQMMLELSSETPDHRFTRQKMRAAAAKLQWFEGVQDFFDRLRNQVEAHHPHLDLEYYVISSGLGEIIRASAIWHHLTDGWASDFACGERGDIQGIKNVVSFSDKTRFLFMISKGIVGEVSRSNPVLVNQRMTGEFRIRFENMIFIGDGFTDIPCFALLKKYGGVPIAVFNRERRENWGKAAAFRDENRVEHLVAADYRPHSGLDDILQLEIRKIAENQGQKSAEAM